MHLRDLLTSKVPNVSTCCVAYSQQIEEAGKINSVLHSAASMRNPPQPLPDNLWGEQWRFAALRSGDLVESIANRTIPIVEMPEALHPINLGVASSAQIPGVIIDGGRRSMQLARWLQASDPRSLNAIAGSPDGLILYAGEVDRWILATFDDPEMRSAAQVFEQRKKESHQLHFLLVEPDDSGMTYTGFWLLRSQGV